MTHNVNNAEITITNTNGLTYKELRDLYMARKKETAENIAIILGANVEKEFTLPELAAILEAPPRTVSAMINQSSLVDIMLKNRYNCRIRHGEKPLAKTYVNVDNPNDIIHVTSKCVTYRAEKNVRY